MPSMSFLKSCAMILLLVFLVADSVDAQRRRRKKDKGKLKILNDLPDFFVDDNKLPKYLKRIYKTDATRLSLRLINDERQRLSVQTVRVPEELVTAVYNALVAVRISDYTAIDTIASKYNIRSFPKPNVETLILVFEQDAEWVEPLRRRQDTTGSVDINNMIREYDLRIVKMVYLDEERQGLVLHSRDALNMPALTNKFFHEIGVGSIDEMLPYGDGNDISIERTKEGWDLVYSIKFGNCINQCQKLRNWRFSVDQETGDVIYSGSSGDIIPPWISLNAQQKRYPDILKRG